MSDTQLERVEMTVPVNNGHLIGNTLRQFAMRGINTWQPAAYRLASKEGSFGISGGYPFSYLKFFDGRLVSPNVSATTCESLCKFELQGEDYVCGDMVLKNLGKIGAPSIDVCLVYAGGSRTAEQNQTVVRRLCAKDAKDFFVVPSRHTPTITFRFKVLPYDQDTETLVIEATPGCIAMARDSAVKSLTGLHI